MCEPSLAMTYALLLHALHNAGGDDPARQDDRARQAIGLSVSTDLPGNDAKDRGIIERLWRDDPTALEQLMLRYTDRMGRLASQLLGSRDAAEDVIQEVFVRTWERRATLDAMRSIRALLLTAVRHRALNDRKYERVREQYRVHVGRVAPTMVESVSGSDSSDRQSEIAAAIAMLPERQQTAIRLRYVDQLSVPEVATVLAIAPNAAHQLIFRALDTLRRRLRVRP
jgi:RNA polymerase sigma factor (sigma-70 family)